MEAITEPRQQETNPDRGLEDPRIIHPSPEEVVPDPSESAKDESQPEPTPADPSETRKPAEVDTGIVDPRSDRFGPDM